MRIILIGFIFLQTTNILNAQVVSQLTEEQQKVLDLAGKYLAQYKQDLTDYLFTQKTCHYSDSKGLGKKWKKTGCIEEEVSFLYDFQPDSKVVNGNPPPHMSWSKTIDYLVVPACVFEPSSVMKSLPEISWQREEITKSRRIFVFSYRVPASRSPVFITDSEKEWGAVGFHGLAFVDCTTGAVIRIENEIEPPAEAKHYRLIRSVIDFGLFNIQGTEYMLPANIQRYFFVFNSALRSDTVVKKCRKFVVKTKVEISR
jgi:hypothetical protein